MKSFSPDAIWFLHKQRICNNFLSGWEVSHKVHLCTFNKQSVIQILFNSCFKRQKIQQELQQRYKMEKQQRSSEVDLQ